MATDEPRARPAALSQCPPLLQPMEGQNMTFSARSMIFSATALIAAIAIVPGAAEAKRYARAGAYNGTWNVVFATRAGNCSATNSVPFAVSGTHVSSAGGGKVTGGVNRRGMVSVAISVGLSHASGSGWLSGNTGAGRWAGVITGDRCSGTWQATRS